MLRTSAMPAKGNPRERDLDGKEMESNEMTLCTGIESEERNMPQAAPAADPHWDGSGD